MAPHPFMTNLILSLQNEFDNNNQLPEAHAQIEEGGKNLYFISLSIAIGFKNNLIRSCQIKLLVFSGLLLSALDSIC